MKNDYPQTLEELTARIESKFERGEIANTATAVTGEPFIKLSIGGLLAEGEAHKIVALDEKAGIKAFYVAFVDYAVELTGGDFEGYKLYWRKKPEVAQSPYIQENYQCYDFADCTKAGTHDQQCRAYNRVTHFYVRARFLISNKEPKQ